MSYGEGRQKHSVMSWLRKRVEGFLLDVYGVLYDSGACDVPIKGSIEAIKRLRDSGVPFRLCSNTSTRSLASITHTLTSLGFDVRQEEIFTPIPAAKTFLRQHNLSPFLIVDPGVMEEFKEFDQSDPSCVLIGDAQDVFTYERLNKAFRLLMEGRGVRLVSLGLGKYYKEVGGLMLDCGAYATGLEYASGVKVEVVGKPSPEFFNSALSSMNLRADQVVMIGDDIVSDVGGAQACGIRGVQVRTGKYRREDEPHPHVTPDSYVENLLEAVQLFLQQQQQ